MLLIGKFFLFSEIRGFMEAFRDQKKKTEKSIPNMPETGINEEREKGNTKKSQKVKTSDLVSKLLR